MYWGYESANAGAGVTQPRQEDNVHGFPLTATPAARPAPRNALHVYPPPYPPPYPPLAIVPKQQMRSATMAERDFHVRVEVTPQAQSADDITNKRRKWKIEAWVERTYGMPITSLSWAQDVDADGNPVTSGKATLTVPGHGFGSDDSIQNIMIRDTPAGFVGDYAATIIDANTIQFSKYPDPGSTVLANEAVAIKLTNQALNMKSTSTAMSVLSPVVQNKNKTGGDYCTSDVDCAASQSCSGINTDGNRYCYSGHQPTVHDQQYIYDIDLGGGSYHDALQSLHLGFTIGAGSSDQVINISEFHTTWLP
jgi:hypothetical protein